jgi:uncharacterized protein YjiS (DUF1127 family)
MTATVQTQIANIQFHGASLFDYIVDATARCMARSHQRRQLAALTARELDDIGIKTDAAAAEAAKPFWKA